MSHIISSPVFLSDFIFHDFISPFRGSTILFTYSSSCRVYMQGGRLGYIVTLASSIVYMQTYVPSALLLCFLTYISRLLPCSDARLLPYLQKLIVPSTFSVLRKVNFPLPIFSSNFFFQVFLNRFCIRISRCSSICLDMNIKHSVGGRDGNRCGHRPNFGSPYTKF